jgi:transcription elongation factor GreA
MLKEVKFKMSKERIKELEEELFYLQTVREKEVAELIREARSFGDLSENSEYDEAKTEQGKLYSKIAELKNILNNAEVISSNPELDKVGLGNKVTVLDFELNEEIAYYVVGSQEADPSRYRISNESPVGSGLFGHKVGDIVEIETPAGKIKFEILKIESY